ncbi:hypothetical protein CLPU_3c01900 [Gottschalkia purinilytica]|uniref:Uncharacterized protein n=1 Tax=Gottschalkia purinilytica TaxID=1503 RepID=A0A0L0WD69_GOTPU|nr:hypothetical protein CLPU_3c01900 [Gottschalkia purinilytica]
MKKILNNIFLIVYPFLLLITMLYNFSLKDQIIRFNINKFQFIVFILVYFVMFALFIFNFFIKKESFHIVSLIIGLIEIILLQIPQILLRISHNLYSVIYGQIQLNIFIFGTLLTLYILMFIMYHKVKQEK